MDSVNVGPKPYFQLFICKTQVPTMSLSNHIETF